MDSIEEAEAYAESDFSEVNRVFVERLFELVGGQEEAVALDLGTGPGDIPIRVSLARPGWHIVGLDASEAMLDFARKAARKAGVAGRIEWVRVDAKHTELAPHSFDVILSNCILHHIDDTTGFWSELKRVGKPGATALLRDLYRPASPEAARRIVETYGRVGPERMQEQYYDSLLASYTPEEVRDQLAQAGLGTLTVSKITDRHMDIFGRLP